MMCKDAHICVAVLFICLAPDRAIAGKGEN